MNSITGLKDLGHMNSSCRLHGILSAGFALGSLSVPYAASANLITGDDPAGFRTGQYDLQVGAANLTFNGTSYNSYPAYNYQTSLATGTGTELIFGPALASGTSVDAGNSFGQGSELLYARWQNGYMAYNPGYTSCDRYGCYSYGGGYYPVVTGAGTSGAWAGGTSGFLGFRFFDSGWHYGWAELAVSDNLFDIGRWAYETVADVGVVTGSDSSLAPALAVAPNAPQNVPEPGTLALLALGAAGLAAFRARRN